MPNVVTIVKDNRLRKQTEQFLQELGMESLRFASFESYDEFASLYFREKKSEPAADQPPVEEGETDLRLFSEVHLLLFALDSIGAEKPKPWLDKVLLQLKKFKQLPPAAPFHMLMLKYEDDGIAKVDLIHPALTDILYLPLDRLVFLQKLEIFLNLPKKVKTSFLFNQEVKHAIEISKISKVERLSDVGLAIRNPVPLKKGLHGHFYMNLPGDKAAIDLHAKVFRSEPHPDLPGQFLVYFSYFGLSKADLSSIRRTLSKAPNYQSLHNESRSSFRFNYSEVFMGEKSRNQHLVVVDPNVRTVRELSAQATKEMGGLDVGTETSYSVFLHNYLSSDAGREGHEPPIATEAADFYQSEIRMRVGSTDGKLISLENPPAPGELLLGHSAEEIFSAPEKWLELSAGKESRLVVEESLSLTQNDFTVERLLVLRDQSMKPRAVMASFKKDSSGEGVSLRIRPASNDETILHYGNRPQHRGLEALLIDSRFTPEDVGPWISGLKTQAAQNGLVGKDVEPKFFFMSESNVPVKKSWLECSDVAGLFLKPVDMRQFMFLLSEGLQNKTTVYNFENLGWSSPGINLHLAKALEMESVSEFGATLKSRQALKAGSLIYLRGSIFKNAPNECLAARVYSSEPHANDKDFFTVHVTYFGINDHFLKFARAWIRENYAATKSQGE